MGPMNPRPFMLPPNDPRRQAQLQALQAYGQMINPMAQAGSPPALTPDQMAPGAAGAIGSPAPGPGPVDPLGDQVRAGLANAMMTPPPLPPGALPDQSAALPGGTLAAQNAAAQQAMPGGPINKLGMLRSAMMGGGLGGLAGGPIGTGVGAGVGMLGQYLKDRRGKNMAAGGVVRLAMGGTGKERKNYPNTTPPPKKRGMGLATRGHGRAMK